MPPIQSDGCDEYGITPVGPLMYCPVPAYDTRNGTWDTLPSVASHGRDELGQVAHYHFLWTYDDPEHAQSDFYYQMQYRGLARRW